MLLNDDTHFEDTGSGDPFDSEPTDSSTRSARLLGDPLLKDFADLDGRVAIFGGSFDPVHNGHLQIAQNLLDGKAVDKVVFLPCPIDPHKSGLHASDSDRLEMLRCALWGCDNLFVSAFELQYGSPQPTVDVLSSIRALLPETAELFFAVGMDRLLTLPKWINYERLFDSVRVIPISRDGLSESDLAGLEPVVGKEFHSDMITLYVEGQSRLSSTKIRNDFTDGESPPSNDALPTAVQEYIKSRDLYQK